MLKVWLLAVRPWSFTAAFVPVALGGALAWSEGTFNLWFFILTLFGGVCLQAGTNLINTYGDYISGVDTIESAKTCPQLVTGMIKPDSMKMAGILVFSLAAVIGLLLAYLRGWEVLAFGVVGLLGGYCYTAGASPYKYLGLGPLFVFFLMGPLMAWPAYFIQTGKHSWIPILAAIPISFLVTGILHANDIRDIAEDRKAGIRTLAMILGFKKSLVLYYMLYAAAYLCLVALVIIGLLPWTAVLPLALVPMVVGVLRRVYIGGKDAGAKFDRLEAEAAGIHFQFGMLMLLGLLVSPYVSRWWI